MRIKLQYSFYIFLCGAAFIWSACQKDDKTEAETNPQTQETISGWYQGNLRTEDYVYIYPTDSTPARFDTTIIDSSVTYSVVYHADNHKVEVNGEEYLLDSEYAYHLNYSSRGGYHNVGIVFRNDSIVHSVSDNSGGSYFYRKFLGKRLQ